MTKGFPEAGTHITHYTNEGAGGPTSTTYQDTEQHLLTMPDLLSGAKILMVAEKYTNTQLAAKIAAAAIGNNPVLTESGVAHRFRRALKSKALAEKVSVSEVTAASKDARKSNGVQTLAARVSRAGSKRQSVSTGPVVDDDESDSQSLPTGRAVHDVQTASQLAAYEEDFGGEEAEKEKTEFASDVEP